MVINSNQEGSAKKRRGKWQVYLGLIISVVCIWYVGRSVEGEELWERIRNVDKSYLALAFVVTFLSYLLRSFRWPFFFEKNPPSFRASFDCVMLGFFVNNILPARLGELMRAHLGGKATKLSRSTVLATVAAERLADGLMISLMFAFLFSYHAGDEKSGTVHELFLVSYFFLFAGAGTIIFLLLREKVYRLLEHLQKIMPGNFSSYTLLRIRYFIEGLAPLLRWKRAVLIAIMTVVIWSVELLAYNFVSIAFAHPLDLGGLSLFLAAVNFSSLIPAAPAGAGVIEWFGKLALERIGVDGETGLAMVGTQHLTQFLVVGIPGVMLFLWRLGGRLPEPEEDSELENQQPESAKPAGFVDVSEPRPQEQNLEQFPDSSNYNFQAELCDLSIVIPAYNEEARLPRTLDSIINFFQGRNCSAEILVVDDGSTDGTAELVRKYASNHPQIRLLSYGKNRGKGYAVKHGVLSARGRRILFNDADGATPIAEIERLESAFENGAQVAIGSRAMSSRDTEVETVWYRKFMGRTFNGIVNLLLLPGIADTQCGFKMFERKIALHLFPRQKAERFSFDCELLYLARKSGCKIVEVPVNWTNIPGSKVDLVKDSMAMLSDLVKFRLRDFFGGYGELKID